MESLPLEYKFAVEKLRIYLRRHPERSQKLAISHFEDFIVLALEYKKLQVN